MEAARVELRAASEVRSTEPDRYYAARAALATANADFKRVERVRREATITRRELKPEPPLRDPNVQPKTRAPRKILYQHTTLPDDADAKVRFSRTLDRMLLSKGIQRADFTRKLNNLRPATAPKIGRHLMGNWLKAINLPSRENLELLAKALDVTAEELMPPTSFVGETPVRKKKPPVQVQYSDDMETMSMRFDGVFPASVGLRILAIINEARKDGEAE